MHNSLTHSFSLFRRAAAPLLLFLLLSLFLSPSIPLSTPLSLCVQICVSFAELFSHLCQMMDCLKRWSQRVSPFSSLHTFEGLHGAVMSVLPDMLRQKGEVELVIPLGTILSCLVLRLLIAVARRLPHPLLSVLFS